MRVPRSIETKFRKELGNVTPYMSVVDIASKELINLNTISEIQELTKKHNYSRLAIKHLNLDTMMVFVHVSQMAFISSRADSFCSDVKQFQKQLMNDKSSPNLDGLDQLRKVLYMVISSKQNNGNVLDKKDESMYQDYAGAVELGVVDYYRRIRNIEFHGGNESQGTHPRIPEEELKVIKRVYNHTPNVFSELTSRDVILYSQAWQKIAVNVCSKLVDINDIVTKLCVKYQTHNDERKDNAIKNKLKQDYLQSDESINELRAITKGWVA